MEAFLRFPLLAPDFHECSECSDQPCSCCNNAPKQGEWNLTAGSPIEARLRNQDWDGNTGTWVRSFENGQHLFIPDVEPRRYQLADEIRPLEKSLDEKILQIIKEESERSNVRQYTCVNGFGYSQFERNIAERIKSLMAVNVTREEFDKYYRQYSNNDSHPAWATFLHFTNQNQGR